MTTEQHKSFEKIRTAKWIYFSFIRDGNNRAACTSQPNRQTTTGYHSRQTEQRKCDTSFKQRGGVYIIKAKIYACN